MSQEEEPKRLAIPPGFTAYALEKVFNLKREMLVHEARNGRVPNTLLREIMTCLGAPGAEPAQIEKAFDAVAARPGDEKARRALLSLIDPLKFEFMKKVVPPGDPLRQSCAEIIARNRNSEAAAGLEDRELRQKISNVTMEILGFMEKGAPVPRPLEKKLVLLLLKPDVEKEDALDAFDAVCKNPEDQSARRRMIDMLDPLRIWTSDAHRLMSPEREIEIMTLAFSTAARETDATGIRDLLKPGVR